MRVYFTYSPSIDFTTGVSIVFSTSFKMNKIFKTFPKYCNFFRNNKLLYISYTFLHLWLREIQALDGAAIPAVF